MDGFQRRVYFLRDLIAWKIILASRCSNRSVGWAQMAQSCQILDPGVEAEKQEWTGIWILEIKKESALHHRIYCVCPLCSQHSEIWENDVKSGSLVTLNLLFSLMWDLRIFERSERSKSFQELRGSPRNDPRMILWWFQEFPEIKIFHLKWRRFWRKGQVRTR